MSAPLRKVERQTERVKKVTDTYRDATGRLRNEHGKFVSSGEKTRKKLFDIEKAAKDAGGAFNGLAKKGVSAFGKIAKYGALAGAGVAAYAGVSSIKKAMSFESQIASIQALTGATDAEMAKMQTLALKMGAKTKYSALEAAQGIEELLKAGLTPATVQAGGLEAALNLATAGGLDLAEAAEIMSTALNAYKKDGMSAADASNILAGTANASATDVHDLRYSLAAVSAVASGLGVTFKDTNTALGLFANNGLKSSDAGTSLKTMLQNLQPTTKKEIALFKKLGLVTKNGSNQFFDAKGNIKSMDKIAGLLRKSLGKLTNQQRSLALEQMFGTDAIRAANILYVEGADGVKKFQKEMSKVTALDVARKKMDTAAGAVEQFKGAIETLQISALLPTMPLIKDFANGAADFVEKYTPEITKAMEKLVGKVKNYFQTNFTNNPEFQKIPTIEGKVKYVFNTLMSDFNAWWDASGKVAVENISKKLVDSLATALKVSQPLIDAAVKVGTAIGSGLLQGILSDPTLAALLGGGAAIKIFGKGGAVKGASAATKAVETASTASKTSVVTKALPFAGRALPYLAPLVVFDPAWREEQNKVNKEFRDMANQSPPGLPKPPGYAAGLDRVPYNNYPARLHRDEMVLTRTEAQKYRESGGNGGSGARPITINLNGVTIREEADIDHLAAKLAHVLAQ